MTTPNPYSGIIHSFSGEQGGNSCEDPWRNPDDDSPDGEWYSFAMNEGTPDVDLMLWGYRGDEAFVRREEDEQLTPFEEAYVLECGFGSDPDAQLTTRLVRSLYDLPRDEASWDNDIDNFPGIHNQPDIVFVDPDGERPYYLR